MAVENEIIWNKPVKGKPTFGYFTDSRDGEKYKCVEIGNQIWMAENLRYAGGWANAQNESFSMDSEVEKTAGVGSVLPSIKSKKKMDDRKIAMTYGRLYSWSTAMNMPSIMNVTGLSTDDKWFCSNDLCSSNEFQGIAPNGWHIPGKREWDELEKFIIECFGAEKFEDVLLESGSNKTGFSAVDCQEYWTATEYTATHAQMYSVQGDSQMSHFVDCPQLKKEYFAIRCVMDLK